MKMETNKIYNEDCIQGLKKLPDKSVNLIVTSPPYNKGFWSSNRNMNNGFKTKSRCIDYGEFSDNLKPEEYDLWQKELISECLRVLKDNGSLFYNHIPIQKEHQEIFPKFVFDFPIKQVIIWNRKNTPKLDKSYFFPTIEYIFWIQKSKTSRTKFNRKNAIFNSSVWEISPDVKNKFPAPFPRELPLNCILSCTDEGDVVLDPFMGSGTTALACVETKRKYIGFEISPEYCKIIEDRIQSAKSQTLLSQPSAEGSLIGIKRKPCEVSQIPNGTSLNSDIIQNSGEID